MGNPVELGMWSSRNAGTIHEKGETTKTSTIKTVARSVALCLIVGVGIVTTTGCDEYEVGTGFRWGNFDQGLSAHVDCVLDPFDSRC